MQKTSPREFRANLKRHIESQEATLISDKRGYQQLPRAILIPFDFGDNPWTNGAKRHALAKAKNLFATAMRELKK
jgi:hypothetical protein